MESMLCRYHKCSSGVRHFQRAVNPSKMNSALEDLQLQKTDNNVETVGALVWSDCRLTVRMIASELNLNHTMVHQILTEELAMKKFCVKFVPKNLTIEQDNRKDVCLHLLERIQRDRNFLKNVITGDETWIFEYDPETKR